MIKTRRGEFEPIMHDYLTRMESDGRPLPPTHVFIDPFGPSGFSAELLSRLARHNMIDILINFNYLEQSR